MSLVADRYEAASSPADQAAVFAPQSMQGDWRRYLRAALGGPDGFFAPLTRALGVAAHDLSDESEVIDFARALVIARADPGRGRTTAKLGCVRPSGASRRQTAPRRCVANRCSPNLLRPAKQEALMTVDLNELISDCEQMLGLDLEAIAQRLGVDPLELDLAAASRSGLSAEYDAAVSALSSQAQAAAERAAVRDELRRFRGLGDDELIAACCQIRDSADAASLIEAAIEDGVDEYRRGENH